MTKSRDHRDVESDHKRSKVRDSLVPKTDGILIDAAISKAKFGKFNYILIFVSGLILNAVLLETCGIAFVIPVSQCDLNLTSAEKGVLGAVVFAGIICSSHLWGYLADTKGRRRVIQPTLFVAFLLSVCSSFVQNFYLLATLRFLNGFFISGSSATIYAYLGEFHDNIQRSRAIMGSAVIFGISCLLLPLIAWTVINQDWQFVVPIIQITYKPWRLFLVVCSLPGFIASIILIFFPESPKFVLAQGNKEQAVEILQKMSRWNNGKDSSLGEIELIEEKESIENRQRIEKCKEGRFPLLESIWIQTAPLFKPPHLGPTMLICTIQFGIYATSNGFYMFYTDILNKMASNLDSFTEQRIPMCDVIHMKDSNKTEDGCITKLELATLEQEILLEIIYAGGFAVISLLVNRIGKFPILMFILSGSGIGGMMCMLTDIPLLQICFSIALMCCGMGVNLVSAATVESYPTALRAMAMCISLMFGRLGSVVGSNVAASMLDNHCEALFYLSGWSVLAMGVLTYFIPNIHNKPTIAKTSIEPVAFRGFSSLTGSQMIF